MLFLYNEQKGGGGDAHQETEQIEAGKETWKQEGGKRLPVVFDVKRTTCDTKSAQNTP